MNQWLQLLFFVAVLGAPALSWVIQKLREQADVKRQRTEAARRREEELRTGRVSQPQQASQPPAREDRMTELQRLAERRQQQLRELRARQERQIAAKAAPIAPGSQAGGSGVGQKLPKGQGMRGQPLPGMQTSQQTPAPTRNRPPQTARRQPSSQGTPGPRSGQQRPSPIRQDQVDIRSAMRQAEQSAAVPVLKGQSISEQLSAAPVSEKKVAPSAAADKRKGVSTEIRSLLRASTRRDGSGPQLATLMALNEVLAKPVSMRDRDNGGGVPL